MLPPLSLKTIVRHGFPFVNFRSMIRLTVGSPLRKDLIFFIFEDQAHTYGEVYEKARRYADFFLDLRQRQIQEGTLGKNDRLCLSIYQENAPEFMFAALGAGLANATLFAVNTGFRGQTLAGVLNRAGVAYLLTDAASALEVHRAMGHFQVLAADRIFITGPAPEDGGMPFISPFINIDTAMAASPLSRKPAPAAMDNTAPVLVIYTSGTTGMPKGVPCTHLKMIGAGAVVQSAVRLKKNDRGYVCMPLFHSNAWYIGILPVMIAGASVVLKRRFSAGAFEADILKHGVTFMNYVGQPLHYIITALEKKYGSPEAVEAALARHPANRFRTAYGNGAPASDRKKLMRYLGMDHIFEIYGSTEAVITTANKPGDPIESLGRLPKSVFILNEQGGVCPPAVVDEQGRILNYDEAVGEIAKKADTDSLRFGGYFDDTGATNKKFRDGIYHSGDLGHVRFIGGRRYLYFNGRTDDWIRKDGENFSAENVLEYALKLPGVKLAAAFGAPSPVSDEQVMIAIELWESAKFDPRQAFDWFMDQQQNGGMDPKWMPDYIRIIDEMPVSSTQKIQVRPFKKDHFHIGRNPDMRIYFRERGDTAYRELTPEAFAEIQARFVETGREGLLSS